MKYLHKIVDFLKEDQQYQEDVSGDNPMILVGEDETYAYYVGKDEERNAPFFNIVPKDQPPPSGGYYNKDYLLMVKKADPSFFSVGNLTKYFYSSGKLK